MGVGQVRVKVTCVSIFKPDFEKKIETAEELGMVTKMEIFVVALVVMLVAPVVGAENSVIINILTPSPGAVVTGGVVHVNYTISHCPQHSIVLVYLNDVQLGNSGDADESFFTCKVVAHDGPARPPGM